jgi:hypothetical protein
MPINAWSAFGDVHLDAPLDGIDVRGRVFHQWPGKLLFSNASRIWHRPFFALGLTQVPT